MVSLGSTTNSYELLEYDYALSVEAIRALGCNLVVPSLEDVSSAIDPMQQDLYDRIARQGVSPELTFHIPVSRTYTANSLIHNAAKGVGLSVSGKTGVFWDRQSEGKHNQGNVGLVPSIALHDLREPWDGKTQDTDTEPVAMRDEHRKPANDYHEAGLVFVGRNFKQQRKALDGEAEVEEFSGVYPTPMSLTEYVVLQAKRIIGGNPLLDIDTTTALPQYAPHGNYGLTINAENDHELRLGGRHIAEGYGSVGVRRVVGLDA